MVVVLTLTATEVFASIAVKADASTDASVIVIVSAFPDSEMPERVLMSLSLIVAVNKPGVNGFARNIETAMLLT